MRTTNKEHRERLKYVTSCDTKDTSDSKSTQREQYNQRVFYNTLQRTETHQNPTIIRYGYRYPLLSKCLKYLNIALSVFIVGLYPVPLALFINSKIPTITTNKPMYDIFMEWIPFTKTKK